MKEIYFNKVGGRRRKGGELDLSPISPIVLQVLSETILTSLNLLDWTLFEQVLDAREVPFYLSFLCLILSLFYLFAWIEKNINRKKVISF